MDLVPMLVVLKCFYENNKPCRFQLLLKSVISLPIKRMGRNGFALVHAFLNTKEQENISLLPWRWKYAHQVGTCSIQVAEKLWLALVSMLIIRNEPWYPDQQKVVSNI